MPQDSARPRLLDLFCSAGGAAYGYHLAGFDVTGVDIAPQPRFPFRFVQADALAFLEKHHRGFDAFHASPPCQSWSVCASMPWVPEYPQLIEPVRALLADTGKPYVIENVIGAPLVDAVMLCGLMFGLKVFRHRLFESNAFLMAPCHPSHKGKRIGEDGFCCVAGHGDAGRHRVPPDHRSKAAWQRAIGIDWMTMHEMAESVPPAYAEFIGRQLKGATQL
jgi:DNA (cytosine-5)-methyltransferase 1